MKKDNGQIQVQQGEDWNLDILISASSLEYIPFIVSNQRSNPFFVVTVASTKYEKNLRYVASWWNDLVDVYGNKLPTFYQTVPYFYKNDVESIASLPSIPPVINSPDGTESKETRLLYQYTLSDEEIDSKLGHKPYHYFYFEYDEDGSVAQRIDEYECRLRFNFSTEETSQWGGQNYFYQITLVSGELLADTLNSIAVSKGMPSDWPNTTDLQYKYVKTHWPDELQDDIDIDSPLGRIDNPQVILQPTTIQVFNNLRTLI